MTPYNKHILTLITVLIFISLKTNAQEVDVIDNKGTIINVKNTRVYTGVKPADADAVIGDTYFDQYPNPNSVEIWDGSSWKVINDNTSHTGTAGSVFFAGATGAPAEDNAQLFWDDPNDRLYLGTPLLGTNKLNVNGTIRTTGLNNAPGTVGLPSYRFYDDSNTGMYRIAEDQLGFSTNGTNALSIDATQNISIPQNLSVTGTYADTTGDVGTSGQILSSTLTGTNWIDNSSSNIYTADGTLTTSRTLTGASNSLIFTGLNTFTTTTLGATTFNSGGATVLNATGGVTINNNTLINGGLELNSTLLDINNEAGTNNQILSSTATGIDWIDNTKNTVNTSSTETTPADYIAANLTYVPIENDTYIYTPTNGEKVYYVYDGAAWNMIAPTKASRVFYPPSIAIDASTAGAGSINLYNDYFSQYNAPIIRSDIGGTEEAPVSIPTYLANELYYYVTYADPSVFGDGTNVTGMSISDTGVLNYTVVTPPSDDNTIINVVFVVK